MLKDGFQNLWKNMASTLNLDIVLNTKVLHVYLEKGKAVVHSQSTNRDKNSEVHLTKFDFLLWSPPVDELMKNVRAGEEADFLREERRLFSGMTNSYYITSLVDDIGTKRGKNSVNWWLENIKDGSEASVWANRDAYTMFNNLDGVGYRNGITKTGNDGNRQKRTSVFYQYSAVVRPWRRELVVILRNHLKQIGARKVDILKQFPWKYFVRFTEPQITEEKRIWRVLDRQGLHGVWFIGASVCFESVKSVVEYNQMLVDRMLAPKEY